MTPDFSADVTLYGRSVGVLVRNRSGLTSFVPDADWIDAGQMPRLGLAFLRAQSSGRSGAGRSSGTGLPLWFENILPESDSALRLRVCKAHGLRETDSLGLLVRLGSDLPGAVRVVTSSAFHDERTESPRDAPQVAEQTRFRFSLAGFQLKFSMAAHGKRFSLPGKDDFGQWIVKVPDALHLELPQIEHLTMRWAEACGFLVPETRVVPVADLETLGSLPVPDDASALAVRRFDRGENGTRVHHEDLLQVLEWHPVHKYGDGDGRLIGYDGLGSLLYDDAGSDVAIEFVRRLAFVVAAGDQDAHLKNWSLLWPEGAKRPTLTPCYDQVALVALPNYRWTDRTPTLALRFGKSTSFATLDAERVITFSERSKIPNAAEHFWAGLVKARDAFRANRQAWSPQQHDAIVEHWNCVPVLRKLGPL